MQYLNVTKDPALLEEMLKHSKGDRRVPVILDKGAVEIGWAGQT